jgi:hypothetical protein
MSRNVLVIGVLAAALYAGACGSSGGSGSGGASGSGGKSGSGGASGTGTGGASNESALQKACRAFCESEGTHNCHGSSDTTTEKCMGYRCALNGTTGYHETPATCAAAYEAYYKCLTAQQAAGTPNPDEPSKPGCQEPGTCETQAAAIPNANCPM